MEPETIEKKKLRDQPKLRFKEFEEDWQLKKFGEITLKVGSGSTPRGGSEVYQENGIAFIRSQNVTQNQLVLDNTFISKEINDQMKGSIVQPNDVLLNITGASIGRSCLVPKDFKIGNVNQHVCIIRLKNNYDPKFIQVFLSSEKGQRLIDQGQTGSGREGLNFQSIRLFKCKLPSLPEQQKIASFLSAVDKKIQKLSRKKELLESYKKGVMQQLFSQEIRFKDENRKEFPEWEVRKLKDVCSVNPKNNELPDSFIYIDLESVTSGKLVKETRISAIEAPSRAQRILKKNDILYQTVRPYQKNNLFFDRNGDYIASTGYAQLRVKENSRFLYQLIHTEEFVTKVLKRCTGTSYPAINSNDLANIRIKVPVKQEQQKIADFLSAIDKKIKAVSQQIEKTQSFKKGLLQQMFV